MPALNYSVTHRIRHSYSYCMANGWLEDKEQHILLHRNQSFGETPDPSAFQLQVTMLKSNKI